METKRFKKFCEYGPMLLLYNMFIYLRNMLHARKLVHCFLNLLYPVQKLREKERELEIGRKEYRERIVAQGYH